MTAKILVVDDVPANVRLLEAKLTADYYDVISAHDGPTALAMAVAEQPDIVLLDVMMPGIMTSSSTMSGCSAAAMASAVGPSWALITS